MVWCEDASMKSDKVWPSICANFACDPEDVLTCPLVSMENADRLHFLFSETMDDDINKVSVVTIDMNTETLVSIDPYINGGDEDDTLKEKCRLRKSFLPSKFLMPPRYLHLTYLVVQCSSTAYKLLLLLIFIYAEHIWE